MIGTEAEFDRVGENLKRDLGFGLEEQREGVLVGGDTLPAHLSVEGNCVGAETFDEGVVGVDIAAANLVEDRENVGAGEGREGNAVKE